ncbi:MAG: PAS domain-containing sensor histidine kinase [Chloroflexota bacterium]|nr:MAG: PAS domain-containing sensor histidine kinase [Chloroflexota bacterium]
MDPTLLAIALAVVLLALASGLLLTQARLLEHLREVTGAHTNADLGPAVRGAIDARETAEWERDRASSELAYLADLLSLGVVRLDGHLRVAFANAAAEQLLGRQDPGLVGLAAGEAFSDPRVVDLARRATEKGFATAELGSRAEGQDGPTLILRARRSPTEGTWLVIEDVSELRRLQRIRSEFIDNLAHELRTPLTNVALLSETLSREIEGQEVTPRMRERVAGIDVETGHLVQMVNELLDLSRIESGQALLLDDVDLGPLAQATVERLSLFAERQGLRLTAETQPDLPPVRGDEDRLGQVVVNLLHNAVKFSPAGSEVTVRVTTGPATLGGRRLEVVQLAVTDHGIGMAPAETRRVFERFYKIDRARSRRAGSGTGLGLSIARHIIESHGGRIWAESAEGQGSTFTFVLPVARKATTMVPAAPPESGTEP